MSGYSQKADFEVNESLARLLIIEQFPELHISNLRLLGASWDNTAYIVNDKLVFRFPRHEDAVKLMNAENNVLPVIAGRLPLPIPVPHFIGHPTEPFPHIFSGYKKLAGTSAEIHRLSDEARDGLAEPLAKFLKSLHLISLHDAREAGAVTAASIKTQLDNRLIKTRKHLNDFSRLGLESEARLLASVITRENDYPKSTLASLVHGDFHARHLLLKEENISGIIDWGDVQIGNPSTDLAVAYLFFPPSSRQKFEQVYGLQNKAVWKEARLHAVCDTAALLPYAQEIEDMDLLFEVRKGLSYLVQAS